MPTTCASSRARYFDADAGAAADPHVLQNAVIDEGERLAVARRNEQDQAAIGPGSTAIFLLGPVAVRVCGQVMMSDFMRIAK